MLVKGREKDERDWLSIDVVELSNVPQTAREGDRERKGETTMVQLNNGS